MSGSQFIELFVGGLAIGCIYSLIALGFTMRTPTPMPIRAPIRKTAARLLE
jgi:hypothetical protein